MSVFNRLSPNIQVQILQTDLHTFPLRIVERIWFKIKAFSLRSLLEIKRLRYTVAVATSMVKTD